MHTGYLSVWSFLCFLVPLCHLPTMCSVAYLLWLMFVFLLGWLLKILQYSSSIHKTCLFLAQNLIHTALSSPKLKLYTLKWFTWYGKCFLSKLVTNPFTTQSSRNKRNSCTNISKIELFPLILIWIWSSSAKNWHLKLQYIHDLGWYFLKNFLDFTL